MNGPLVAARWEWTLNPSISVGDVCKNGKCPDVVMVPDPGGHFAIAGYTILNLVLQSEGPVPAGELSGIRADVATTISNKECAGYLKALLDEAAVLTGQPYRDIMVVFDNTKFSYANLGPSTGEASGSFEDGTAGARISSSFKNEKFISADRSSFIRTQTALNFLAETLHHVGAHEKYRDGFYANALNAILVRQGKDEPRTYSDATNAAVSTASTYWHYKVDEACKKRHQ